MYFVMEFQLLSVVPECWFILVFRFINFVSYIMISGLIGGVKLGQIKKLPSEPPQALGMFMETLALEMGY